jgi:acetyl-CoA decarbonylase/synthase complex subunit delta
LGFAFHKESYTGKIREIALGKGKKTVTVGGESCYPFYQFEGAMPHPPRIAMEVWDTAPEDWPDAAVAPFKDVLSDPAAWAKKCVAEHGAEIIVLQLKSTDPNGKNASAADAVKSVKKVRAAVDVPLVVWGSANTEKDEVVLKKIAEECQGENLVLGPVEDKNHKAIGAAAMGFGHSIISSSPIDVNLAKQINILLENLGVPTDRMLIDPTTGGIGYGMEYTYSVMERIRMAALAQGDDKLQFPIINNLGNEVWKCKEAKQSADEAPTLGDPERRGILMEAVGAVAYLMSGADVLIMRHPEAIRLVKSYIGLMVAGGDAKAVAPIAKRLPAVQVDLLAKSPAPNLTIAEEKKAAPAPPPKAAAAPKPEAKAAPAAPAAAPAAAAPKVDEAAAKARVETDARAKAEAEAQAKAAAEARVKLDAAAQAKAEEDARKKAEADAKAKAEAEARAKAEAEAQRVADEKAKLEAELDKVRQQRAKEREELAAQRAAAAPESAVLETSITGRMADVLVWVHRRNR